MTDGLETTQAAPIGDSCWYQPTGNGGRYWHTNDDLRWVHKNSSQFTRWAMTMGLLNYIPDAEKSTRVLSQIDELLTRLETNRIIDYAGGLAGWQAGIYEINRARVLVTHSPHLIEPQEPEHAPTDLWDFEGWGWPTLGAFLDGFFNGIEHTESGPERIEQLPRFVCWCWHFLTSLYASDYSTGMCLALAGMPGSGKSLLAQIIQQLAGGIVARPYRYMIGADNFNEEFLEASLLLVDDENSDTHIQSRLKFASEIKQIVATRGTRIRAMHQKAIVLQPIQRLVICVNLEPERLQVLPPIDADIRDKMLVLKGYYKPMPMPTNSLEQSRRFWDTLMDELPRFVHWLLNVYRPRHDELDVRFGPAAWQHPEILEELSRLNPEARTEEFLVRFIETRNPKIWPSDLEKLAQCDRDRLQPHVAGGLSGWIGTVSDLRAQLMSDGDDSVLSALERREVRATPYLGRDLTALSRRNPDCMWQSRVPGSGKRLWIILSNPLERDSK